MTNDTTMSVDELWSRANKETGAICAMVFDTPEQRREEFQAAQSNRTRDYYANRPVASRRSSFTSESTAPSVAPEIKTAHKTNKGGNPCRVCGDPITPTGKRGRPATVCATCKSK